MQILDTRETVFGYCIFVDGKPPVCGEIPAKDVQDVVKKLRAVEMHSLCKDKTHVRIAIDEQREGCYSSLTTKSFYMDEEE